MGGSGSTYSLIVRLHQHDTLVDGTLQIYRGKIPEGRPVPIRGSVSGHRASLWFGREACGASIVREGKVSYLHFYCPLSSLKNMSFLKI